MYLTNGDATNAGHTLGLSMSANNSGGDAITDGVAVAGTAGSAGQKQLFTSSIASTSLYVGYLYGYDANGDAVSGAGGTNHEVDFGPRSNGTNITEVSYAFMIEE